VRERSIDYLLMQNREEYFARAVRWFTDDEMTSINCEPH
jgi:hypothetical protein